MPPIHSQSKSAFTIVCRECDAGLHLDIGQQAAVEGWTAIDYAPDLPMANYVGLCPDCREHLKYQTAQLIKILRA